MKNSFGTRLTQNLVRKLLNSRSTDAPKFAKLLSWFLFQQGQDFSALKLYDVSCVTISVASPRSEMDLRDVLATLAILLGRWQSLFAQAHRAPMLEIRVDTPKWVNGCLDLTIELANISKHRGAVRPARRTARKDQGT